MKQINILLGQLMLALGLTAPGLSTAAGPVQAYIRTSEHGQALLLSRLGECYAVTPAHVIGDDLFATLTGGASGAPQGDGDLLQTFGYDLSILRTTGAVSQQCGASLGDIPSLDGVLSNASDAIVSSVNGDGSITRRNVTINDVSLLYIRIRPRGPDDQLFKGLSGSLVLTGDQPVGILMRLDPDTGEGRALRYDRALETLRPFFGLPASGAKRDEPASTAGGSSALNGRVISWSSPSLNVEHRATNLMDAAGTDTVWLSEIDNFPVELVIELPGDEAQVVDALRLVGDGVEPRERRPRDFEVLISSGGGWIPVGSGTYFMNDADKLVRFAPMRTHQIMLRIYSHWGDSEALGLSGIEVPKSR